MPPSGFEHEAYKEQSDHLGGPPNALLVHRLLRRELQHMAWLEANMAGKALLDQCKLRLEKFKDSLSSYGQ